MTIKEKPLIRAVERLGPLPGFLFANPIFTGFFAFMMVPVFGGVFMLFWGSLGTVNARELFEAARWGAIGTTIFATFILIGIAFSAFREPDEKVIRLQFVLGGTLAIALLITIDVFCLEALRTFFDMQGPIAGPSSHHR